MKNKKCTCKSKKEACSDCTPKRFKEISKQIKLNGKPDLSKTQNNIVNYKNRFAPIGFTLEYTIKPSIMSSEYIEIYKNKDLLLFVCFDGISEIPTYTTTNILIQNPNE